MYTEDDSSLPAGWQILQWLPYYGKRWLDALAAHSIVLSFQDEPKSEVKETEGIEKFILLQEEFEHNTGNASGVRVIALTGQTIKFVDYVESAAEPNQVKVSVVREPLSRQKSAVLATLEKPNDKYILINTQEVPLPIIPHKNYKGNIEAESLLYCNKHDMKSGERFIVGFSEFEFIELPVEHSSASNQSNSS